MKIFAHRGASGYAPENTLVAIKKAIEMKADGIEIDIQLTKDGKIVVMHDWKVDRTTTGRGFVYELDFDYIRSLDAGQWYTKDFIGEVVPTLEEVLDILSEICEDVSNRLQYSNKVGKTITLKVKYDDFTKITRSISLEHPIYKAVDIRTSVYNLVKNLEKNKGKIRLLGVTVSNLSETEEEFKNITISEYLDNIKETTK